MSIDQSETVDIISQAPDGTVVLTISDHLEWDAQNEHLFLLQEKLNSYFRFLESGKIYESYPSAKGANFLLSLVCQFRPTEVALGFLERVRSIAESAGCGFSWRPLNGAYIDDHD
ncbi:DUF6572 domain-containing protein [Stutzerimonas stutzeri]|uniref:DUF6572 domain-containing protein n=1 Tax=Stutzerimonas TaxID=2901164 RepID=UPI001BAEEC38|nr:DUF6572 domain-containing protein [Stutzerimonas stutzeri]QUE76052.1 hypothetical protein KCX70_00275 [Stutzerimonas stutzeri]